MLARSWFARHLVLSTWALFGVVIAVIALRNGADLFGAIGVGAAVGGLLVLVPFMFDPFPFPLTREQWPMKMPVLRGLTHNRHWANIFYVDVIRFRTDLRPQYCADQLSGSLLKFPWLPLEQHNIAGWVRGNRFVLKRLTWWANGMRPTASGRFDDAKPGTAILLSVAAPAVGTYIFLGFLVLFGSLLVVVSFALATQLGRADLVLIVFGMILLTFVFTALFASPVPPPIARLSSEGDRYIAFFCDVLGASVISRE